MPDPDCSKILTFYMFDKYTAEELVTYMQGCSCSYSSELPTPWQQRIINIYKQYQANPSGIWADYNYVWRLYSLVVYLSTRDLICYNDIPSPPRVEDYPDLTSPSTLIADDGWYADDYRGRELGIKFTDI